MLASFLTSTIHLLPEAVSLPIPPAALLARAHSGRFDKADGGDNAMVKQEQCHWVAIPAAIYRSALRALA